MPSATGKIQPGLKPTNVMVISGELKLLDFGIAGKMGTLRSPAGTIEYMAPEQFLDQPASPASDLYAVGVLAYELLTGHFPYNLRSMTAFLSELLGEQSHRTLRSELVELIASRIEQTDQTGPELLSLDRLAAGLPELGRVAPIISRLTARVPTDRYADAGAVIRDLGAALGQSLPVDAVATAQRFPQAAEFVGREAELAELEAALGRTLEGHGGLFLVVGESGVGKSRLLRELHTLALVRSARVVRAQASSEGGISYQLWTPVLRALCLDNVVTDLEIAILRDAAPDLESLLGRTVAPPPPLPPDAARLRLQQTITALVRRQELPLVLLWEDLHLAGSETLELLARLTALLAELAILIVGTCREHEQIRPLDELLPARRIRLGRLGDEGIAALGRSMLGPAGERPEVVQYLRRHTDGNLLFLVELLGALITLSEQLDIDREKALPDELLMGGIQRLLQRHLEKLRPSELALLEVAAVAGRSLDVRVLAQAAGAANLSPWLLSCASAGVIEAEQDQWQFSQARIREWLLANLTTARAHALHEQVAAAIASVYPGDPAYDAALAFHYGKAGRADLAAQYSVRAGQESTRLYALVEARAHYRAALTALGQLPDTQDNRRRRIDILLPLAWAATWADTFAQVSALLQEGIALLDSFGDAAQSSPADVMRRARIFYLIGRTNYSLGAYIPAIDALKQSRALAQRCQADSLAGASLGLIGHLRYLQGYFPDSLSYLRTAQEELARCAIPERARTMACLGLAIAMHGSIAEGLAIIEKSKEQAVEQSFTAAYFHFQCPVFRLCEQWESLAAAAAQALNLATAAGDNRHTFISRFYLARAEAELGMLESAVAHINQAHSQAARQGESNWGDLCGTLEAEVALAQGRLDAAITGAQKSIAIARRCGALSGQSLGHRVWAQALARSSPLYWEEAAAHFAASVRLQEEGEMWPDAAITRLEFAQLYLQRGDAATAAAILEPALRILAVPGLEKPYTRALALGILGGEPSETPHE